MYAWRLHIYNMCVYLCIYVYKHIHIHIHTYLLALELANKVLEKKKQVRTFTT